MDGARLTEEGVPPERLFPILSLLASAVLLAGDLEKRRHHLLAGLAQLLGASSWTWTQQGLRKEDGRKLRSRGYACAFPGAPDRGPQLVATRSMDRGASAKAVFDRLPGECDFEESEVSSVSLTLEEVPWLFGDFFRDQIAPCPRSELALREEQVLTLMKEGLSRYEIVEALSLSESDLAQSIRSLFSQLGFVSHSQLLSFALRPGHRDSEATRPEDKMARPGAGAGATKTN